jgi:hypothetical protein
MADDFSKALHNGLGVLSHAYRDLLGQFSRMFPTFLFTGCHNVVFHIFCKSEHERSKFTWISDRSDIQDISGQSGIAKPYTEVRIHDFSVEITAVCG